jgi:hypothetical protein
MPSFFLNLIRSCIFTPEVRDEIDYTDHSYRITGRRSRRDAPGGHGQRVDRESCSHRFRSPERYPWHSRGFNHSHNFQDIKSVPFGQTYAGEPTKDGDTKVCENQLECVICGTAMTRKECYTLPNCGHMFHKACIKEWHENNPTCPFCRASFSLLEQEKCTVCDIALAEEQCYILTRCGHMFHINCMNQWYEEKASCPVCHVRVYNSYGYVDIPKNVKLWSSYSVNKRVRLIRGNRAGEGLV